MSSHDDFIHDLMRHCSARKIPEDLYEVLAVTFSSIYLEQQKTKKKLDSLIKYSLFAIDKLETQESDYFRAKHSPEGAKFKTWDNLNQWVTQDIK